MHLYGIFNYGLTFFHICNFSFHQSLIIKSNQNMLTKDHIVLNKLNQCNFFQGGGC
uniref:Uncharacterized protein n=1 Tax=Anguilla anguilla TaxID=7936 RepID=A0A0E9PU21_ANGAN